MWIIDFARQRPPFAFFVMGLLNLRDQVAIGGLTGATLALVGSIAAVFQRLRRKA
jgi:hypothetical protein